jgi:D-ala-D-ala dipeptidase
MTGYGLFWITSYLLVDVVFGTYAQNTLGLGFVNYSAEWWHYDLGDCIWATTFNLDWLYGSMEGEV